jgi:hypothetical protein
MNGNGLSQCASVMAAVTALYSQSNLHVVHKGLLAPHPPVDDRGIVGFDT